MMAYPVRIWMKFVSGIEYDNTADAEKLVVNHAGNNEIIFEFWDYEGKRGEMTMPTRVATILSRSIMLCVEGPLDHIAIDL
ncbi:MAG: hypothetical protein PHE15_06415 [Dehalococcoidales bacterium]|jgi:hypothetical protein|nr:hypothetical protein [Dehalococcoidales bacterium]